MSGDRHSTDAFGSAALWLMLATLDELVEAGMLTRARVAAIFGKASETAMIRSQLCPTAALTGAFEILRSLGEDIVGG